MSMENRPQNVPETVDVAVIGGSFAGLSAALYLGRARQRVVVYDLGETRNRFSTAGHGFLGQDGVAPAAIQAAGRADVLAYPTVQILAERVTQIERRGDVFAVQAKTLIHARRVILSYGMVDTLPALPGLAQGWGDWALQCPYCHGYENADRATGILMGADGLPHHASLLRAWTDDLTVFANGYQLTADEKASLAHAGIALHESPVVGFQADTAGLRVVQLQSGAAVACAVIYLTSRSAPACDLGEQLGCAQMDGPTGPYLEVDMMQQSSVPGVYAAGDLSRPVYGAVFAARDGAMAGVAAHQSLIPPL
ncbi:hypothetical protein GCM10010873_16090 [Cypionkella aquatica]|uniref:Thioredoxin reductase n=1 Tax=Cypionkella aquatica TaxID=1756042 RepID=A0AA37U360_9RHOB|nr:NAD(P)/FAD-dependent oxidoreductase [Cypionkella aquatica]GLS86635.1 hypothetical protein GCM10010873_16090 [Cypionkella aquatica]